MITSAFTCTGPYAVLIMLGIKRVENRGMMPSPAKGRCAVSCSKKFCKEEYGNFVQWASRALPPEAFERIPAWSDVKDWPGKVVGCCDYAARAAREPYRGTPREVWDEGYPYRWDLEEVVCFDNPIPCRGNVGMWQMSEDLAAHVTRADQEARSIGVRIDTAEDAVKLFRLAVPIVGSAEGFWVLPLDGERRTLAAPILVSLGVETNTTAVRPRDVFWEALKLDASSIIVAHNHPRGTMAASTEDIQLTDELRKLSDALEIKLLDHIVLGRGDDWCQVK